MKICTICIGKFGFKLIEKEKTFNTDEEMAEHLENFHGQLVKRKDETEKQCIERCRKKGIVGDLNKCQCEECKMRRGEKNKITITGIGLPYVN